MPSEWAGCGEPALISVKVEVFYSVVVERFFSKKLCSGAERKKV
jgi:hypothetical protein